VNVSDLSLLRNKTGINGATKRKIEPKFEAKAGHLLRVRLGFYAKSQVKRLAC